MATKKNNTANTNDTLVLKAVNLGTSSGYGTKVRVLPNNHIRIVQLASLTGLTLVEVSNELLSYALDHTQLDINGQVIDVASAMKEE